MSEFGGMCDIRYKVAQQTRELAILLTLGVFTVLSLFMVPDDILEGIFWYMALGLCFIALISPNKALKYWLVGIALIGIMIALAIRAL